MIDRLRRAPVALSWIATVAAVAPTPAASGEPADCALKEIRGTWEFVSAGDFDDAANSAGGVEGRVLEFTDETIERQNQAIDGDDRATWTAVRQLILHDGERKRGGAGYRIDPTRTPPAIDLFIFGSPDWGLGAGPLRTKAIYRLRGKTLEIRQARPNAPRPRKLRDAKGTRLLKLERTDAPDGSASSRARESKPAERRGRRPR